MRKLATIQKINKICEIPGADNIVCATVLGWEIIIRKEDFKEGDKCIYVEIDSVLPPWPDFEFMKSRKYRIKTIKLRGHISQGICFPLSILSVPIKQVDSYPEGHDVTDFMNIKKYDPQANAEAKELENRTKIEKSRIHKYFMRHSWFKKLTSYRSMVWPQFIRKTDEERIQSHPEWIDEIRGKEVYITEKLDGCSATYYCIKNKGLSRLWKPYIWGICSRNKNVTEKYQNKHIGTNVYKEIAESCHIKAKLLSAIKFLYPIKQYVYIQGEIIGPKVQGNKYNIINHLFYVFNVNVDGRFLLPYHRWEFIKSINLRDVPFIAFLTLKENEGIPELVNYADRTSKIHKIPMEGVILRTVDEKTSFKVINPKFLLQYEND